jgi:hypothetical protein
MALEYQTTEGNWKQLYPRRFEELSTEPRDENVFLR